MVNKGEVREAKENLLLDISNAFDEGLYNDITFVLADNVNVSTSKFMLACRVPYFSSLLFGGFADTSIGSSVPLTCCDSGVFKKILNFIFKGEVSFSDFNMPLLLNVLEASRFFCLDNLLKEGIIDYLQCLLDDERVDFKDSLEALEFTTRFKFGRASESLLSFIDRNLSAISEVPEFGKMSEFNLKIILGREGKVSPMIVRFAAFAKWLEFNEGEPISVNLKSEVLSLFELRNFNSKDLVKIVMKSKLFDNSEICQVLGERLDQSEETVRMLRRSVFVKRCEILDSGRRKSFVVESPFSGCTFDHMEFFLSTWSFPKCNENFEEKCINNCGFLYSYDVLCSQNMVNWTKIASCVGRNCGLQKIDFEPREMIYIAVELNEGVNSESTETELDPALEDIRLMIHG